MNPTLEATITSWLDSIAQLQTQADQLDADLQSDPRYAQLAIIRANIDKCEAHIKDTLKACGLSEATVQSSGYEAVLQTRHMKEVLHYDIQAIEQEPTLATTIIKTVDEKLFKAIVEAKSLDISMFCTPEPGKEVQAVSIHKVQDNTP